MKQKTGILIALVSFLFAGCSFLFENNDFEQRQSDGQTACIYVKSADVLQNTARQNRTALPSAIATNLTDLVLKGGKTGDSQIELAHADTLQELSQQVIEVSAGLWNFTLEAKLNGIAFSGSITGKNIRGGKSFSLSFGLTTNASYGGFSITVAFEGSADLAYGILYYEDDTLPPVIAKTQLPVTENTVTFAQNFTETTGLAGGTYKAKILFYKKDTQNNNNEIPLNTYEEAVQITPGYISSSEITINLTSTYSIIYHYDDEASLAFGETMPKQYSRISGDITLPLMQKEGFVFGGWFDTSACDGNAVISIPHGSTGTKEYWAKFSEKPAAVTFYVKQDGEDWVDTGDNFLTGGTEDAPFKTIRGAITAIKWDVQHSLTPPSDYIIKVIGFLEGKQSLNGQYQADFGSKHINSITVEGAIGLDSSTGEPLDGIDATGDEGDASAAFVIIFNGTLGKLVIKNLMITGGNDIGIDIGSYGSGLGDVSYCQVVLDEGCFIEENNDSGLYVAGACSALMKNGAVITGNRSKGSGGGVYVSINAAFSMQGGIIQNNSLPNIIGGSDSYYGRGVYVAGELNGASAGYFEMSGDAVVDANSSNDVYIGQGAYLNIAGPLSGINKVAIITPYRYAAKDTILQLAKDENGNTITTTTIAEVYNRFSVVGKSTGNFSPPEPWHIDENGQLQEGLLSISSPITFYVAPNGDNMNGDGSESKPFQAIGMAAYTIIQTLNERSQAAVENTDCTIKVNGMYSTTTVQNPDYVPQMMGYDGYRMASDNVPKSFVIEGVNGLGGSGIPQDGIDATGCEGTAFTISTNIPVVLKNLKITGANNGSGNGGGLHIGGTYTDIDGNTTSNTTVCLGEGVLVTGNTAAKGGGAYIYQNSTLKIDGGKITGNTGNGAGVFISKPSTLAFSGAALITSDNDVMQEGTTSFIEIAGPLTQSEVATITPSRYQSNDEILSLSFDHYDESTSTTYYIDTTTIVAEHSKFKVTPRNVEGSLLPWHIDTNGKLQEGSGSSNGPSEPVNFYISPTGNDSNDASSQSNAVATVNRLVESMTDEDTDYIINVCGDMTTGSESEWLMTGVTTARSITIQGIGDTNEGNILPGVWVESKAPVIFKNIQLGALFAGAVQYDEDDYYHAYVTLDTGTLIKNSNTTSINGHSMNGVVEIYQKGAVTLIMKSGAEISTNTLNANLDPTSGYCGGVYIGQYSEFRMEGGTISDNALFDVSNCNDGKFYVSGDAQAGNVYCKSYYQPNSWSVPIYISGPLTSSHVAVITPGFYSGSWQAIELEKDEDDNPITTTTIGNEYLKFGVYDPDTDDDPETFWMLWNDGTLTLKDITD